MSFDDFYDLKSYLWTGKDEAYREIVFSLYFRFKMLLKYACNCTLNKNRNTLIFFLKKKVTIVLIESSSTWQS